MLLDASIPKRQVVAWGGPGSLHAAGKEQGRRALLPFWGHEVGSLVLTAAKTFPDVHRELSLAPSTDAEITRQATDSGPTDKGPEARGSRETVPGESGDDHFRVELGLSRMRFQWCEKHPCSDYTTTVLPTVQRGPSLP